ncbi:MAG: 3'(2'),5'-bisphosphate nucleotidase CysQ [Rhodospirillaceae bacterium]|nr:3'(2'),5'-bisphosphate nucleotidase CysQ [Rhodospirillaceae bacterium]
MSAGLASLIPHVVVIARQAGAAIMPYFRGDYATQHKDDRSPVTDADHAADAVLKPALAALLPGVPVVTEESVAAAPAPESLAGGRFWLVDPLDGTKEFVAHRAEFTVNIGLIEDGHPVLGVLLVPPTDVVYAAAGPGTAVKIEGQSAPRPIAARAAPAAGIAVTHSRSHSSRKDLDDYLAPYRIAERLVLGSALKFGLIAEGRADLYPRFGPTGEWDTAAGQAILEAAGGTVLDHAGRPLGYGKENFRNPGFIARGRGAPPPAAS